MATCAYCGTTILFGGATVGELRFCNQTCAGNGAAVIAATRVAPHEVEKEVRAVHQGNCPQCQGPGPVDVHVAHKVWSALAFTSWGSKPRLCCRSCGRKHQLGSAAFSLVLGWWGFPWGLIMTPVQVTRNLSGMFGGPNPESPSPALERIVRLHMVSRPGPKVGLGERND